MSIYIFKTSIASEGQKQQVEQLLAQQFPPIYAWSFDLEDCDKVLKIKSREKVHQALIQALTQLGIHCELMT
ncbi:MAG: hypothetical protein AAGD05_17010 [Bacteroidota bacterium]